MSAAGPSRAGDEARRDVDIVLFGATGFTGRLVAEVLQRRAGPGSGLRWAMAGRDATRLAAVKEAVGAGPDVPLWVADAADAPAMTALVRRASVVITTVGPYQRHGGPLVDACAEAGTDYVDLCGEPLWMARMIPRLQAKAARSGARIVFSCGFDSVPFDLGVVFLQQAMQARFGRPAVEVRSRVREMKGTFSGGTVASALATVEAIGRDTSLAVTMADPFALTPDFRGPPQPDDEGAQYDDWAGAWTAPFLMAPINTKNVHRTHALRGHPWGTGFRYSERVMAGRPGRGDAGRRKALWLASQARWTDRVLALAPARSLLARWVLPKPGEGPDASARERGRYTVALTGETADGQRLTAVVRGQGDPGYGSTSRMITEAALCLRQDVDRQATPGGVWTAGAAMGLALQRRLQAHAGLHFGIEA